MTVISFIEIIYILITTLVIGYVFMGLFPFRGSKKDILQSYIKRFDWSEFWFACLVAAPGVIFHEMGHKFVAMAFGLGATFYIWPLGLGIAVLLKLFGSGFILLAPGYVLISNATLFQGMITSFAGPFVNLALWISSILVLKYVSSMSRRQAIFWNLTKQINKWLFIFNMIPVPPLDGFNVITSLIKLIF